LIGVVFATDQLDEIVTKREVSKDAFASRRLPNDFMNSTSNLLSQVGVLWIRLAVHE
jgi:hypothetical protein